MSGSRRLRWGVMAILLVAFARGAWGDDTDIYIENSLPSGAAPLVMFSLDYRANLDSTICANVNSSCIAATYFRDQGLTADVAALPGGKLLFFDYLRLSIKVVFQQPEFAGLKVGLMMSHNDENNCVGPQASKKCSHGGAILRGFEELPGSAEEFNNILSKLREIRSSSSAADHLYQGAELFFEFFRYLTGQAVFNGHNGWVDYEKGNNTDTSTNMSQYSPASWDATIEDSNGALYLSPLTSGSSCTKVYTINFTFGNSQDNTAKPDYMTRSKADGGFGPDFTYNNNDPFLPVIEYLRRTDLADGSFGSVSDLEGSQGVTSYFFVKSQQTNKVDQYAAAGGTTARALGDNPEDLVKQLSDIFREILSTSTTFVAASIPVNVFNRASVVNNVYIALFQADAEGKPYWTGNLKKLKIGSDTLGNPQLVDANNQSAVGDNGRIRPDALTLWTNGSVLAADASKGLLAGKDGSEVARGGAGQKIPGYLSGTPGLANSDSSARQLYYLNRGAGLLQALNATSTLASSLRVELKAGDDTEALALLKYARGLNDAGTGPRPWIMADPLHSRPLPINYGAVSTGAGNFSQQNPGIYIAVASNDGYLRFIENTTPAGAESGREVWAFMPPEGLASLRASPKDYAIQKLLKANSPSEDPRHPYSVDGAPTVYVKDVDLDGTVESGDKVVIYFGLRRGGSAYYAIDVTNPLAPQYLWRIDQASSGFSEMGLSFSTPKLGTVRVDGETLPALFFGGGYDENKDLHQLGTNDAVGRAVYVVNAETGALIWRAQYSPTGPSSINATLYGRPDMLDSIPSDVTIADTDGDGFTDRLLVGDTGGNLWRADFVGTDTDNWKMSLLAKLGRHESGSNNRSNDRRFFHEPDLVQTKEGTIPFDAVAIGSGDREDPLDKGGSVSNYFYMIRDSNTLAAQGADLSYTHAVLTDLSEVNCAASATDPLCSATTAQADGSRLLNRGWKFLLPSAGEKALAPALTFSNTVYFTSYVPHEGGTQSCTPNEGSGKQYAVSLRNAAPVFSYYDDNSASLSLSDRSDDLKSPGIPAQVVYVPGTTDKVILRPDLTFGEALGSNRFRTYWQEVEQ